MTHTFDTIVIGGGQAGLAMGYTLQQLGIRFVILEAGIEAVGSWRSGYDSLKLFSPKQYSSLPGMPFPGEPDAYPTRDEVIAYFRQYVAHFNLPIVTQTRVASVRAQNGGFALETEGGVQYQARSIVAASGSFSRPNLPRYPSQSRYKGSIMHSSAYRNADKLIGKRVVVVGAKNSALQIAVELAQYAEVTLATRHPVNLAPQTIGGKDVHFWLTVSGVDTLPLGHRPNLMQKLLSGTGAIDIGGFKEALASGNPKVRPMFERFTETGLVWQDGAETEADAVIFATGFRPNLDYLASLNALDADGHPFQKLGISSTVDGLYYMGLAGQRSHASATIRGVGKDAALVGERIKRYLAGQACCRTAAVAQGVSRLFRGALNLA